MILLDFQIRGGKVDIIKYENYHEGKKHGDFSFPYTTYICTIPLSFSCVPLHWHEELEIIYIKKGQGIVTVNLTTIEVKEGSIILVLPGQLHSISQDGNYRMEYENILFHTNLLISSKMDSCNQLFFEPLLLGKIQFPTVYIPGDPFYPVISTILDECDQVSDIRPDGYQLFLKSKLLYLFYEMNNNCRLRHSTLANNKAIERMKPVLKYIELHYSENICIEQIAEVAACSSSHFMRIFKETFGKSFIEYLKEYRLTMAARLLRGSDSTVLGIASDVGFDNLSYFNRSFKEQFGMTPGKYRKEYK